MSLFYNDMQEELDLVVDGAAGFLPPLCKGSGGQHELGTYPISPKILMFSSCEISELFFFFQRSIPLLVVSLFCVVTCLHFHLCCEKCHPLFIAFLPLLFSSLKSYYRSGSIPELLLTLLSNWKRSVKPRPAVSYVNCRPVQAAAVCPLSLSASVAAPARPSFFDSLTPALAPESCVCDA